MNTALVVWDTKIMAQKRMIDKKISLSEKVADLDLLGKLLYTWMIPHADDIGLLQGSARTIKGAVFPLEDITVEDVKKQLEAMRNINLIKVLRDEKKVYFYIVDFEKNQTLKKDRQPQTILSVKADKEPKESWKNLEKKLKELTGNHLEPIGIHLESEVKRSEVKRSEVNNNENSDKFSELKDSLGISDVPVKGITTEHQSEGVRIAKALGAPKERYSAYFKAIKEEPRAYILEAFGFAQDHPTPEARDKMFFWKLNQLKGGKSEKPEASL